MKKLIKPCPKCPYKLGTVKTFTNPCPQCEADNYSAYERFRRTVGGDDMNKHEDGEIPENKRRR